MALEIDLLAVGNCTKSGDAILIRYGDLDRGGINQTVILIDGGYPNTAEKIKGFLDRYYNCKNSEGKFVIDLMILSHPDLDHVGGLVELSKDLEVKIERILMQKPWSVVNINDFRDGRITQNSLKNRLKESFKKAYELYENIPPLKHRSAYPHDLSLKDALIRILGPSKEFYRRMLLSCPKTPDAKIIEEKDQRIFCQKIEEENFYPGQEIDWNYDESTSCINESSLVILFQYEGHNILLTGDSGKEGLEEAIEYAESIGIDLSELDIIKMPHHGSRKNVTPEIMDQLGSEGTRCYISCAEGDEGHHPSKRLVNMLNQKGFRVLTTSGSNLHMGYDAPDREDYVPAIRLGYYPTIEKL